MSPLLLELYEVNGKPMARLREYGTDGKIRHVAGFDTAEARDAFIARVQAHPNGLEAGWLEG